MPLYFPRTKDEEELAAKALPADLGNEYGEPIIQERKIRISDNPLVKGRYIIIMEEREGGDGVREDDAWKR